MYRSDHDQTVMFCHDHTPFLWLKDGNRLTTVSIGAVSAIKVLSATLGDFSGNGYQELAISCSLYDSGYLMLVSFAHADGAPRSDPFVRHTERIPPLLSITAGDFNGDSRAEVAGLEQSADGRPPVVIYTVDPKTLAATKTGETKPNYQNDPLPISFYSMTAGNFTPAAHQQLILAATSNRAAVKLISFDFAPSSTQPFEASNFIVPTTGGLGEPTTNPPNVNFIQVQAARFAWQGLYDQIAFQYSNYARFASVGANRREFIAIYQIQPSDLSFQQKSLLGTNDPGDISFRSPMIIGNFDNSQNINGKRQYNPGLQLASAITVRFPTQLLTYLVVYNVDPTTFRLDTNQEVQFTTPNASSNNIPYFYLSAGDLQGRSYVLGDPTKLTLYGTVQPSVIAGVPPMHIDYTAPAGGQHPEVFNISADPLSFNTSYQTSNESRVEEKNTDTISWSAGAKQTVDASASIGLPNVADIQIQNTFTAAQNFKGAAEKQYGNFQSQSYSRSSTTGYGDFVMFSQQNFFTWIYPVIGRTICPAAKPNCTPNERLPMTIQFSAPGSTTFSSIGSAIPWFQPPWEPGNILSYPATYSQLEKIYPNLQLLSKNSYQWFTDSSKSVETTSWNVGSSNGTTSTLDKTFSFENDYSVAGKGKIGGVGVGASLAINLSGSFGFSSLRQATTTVGQSTGIGVAKAGAVKDPTFYQYGVTSYLIGRTRPGGLLDTVPPTNGVQTFDYLQAAFVADPLDGGAGSWWRRSYSDHPDVALNHPSRWLVETEPATVPPRSNCVGTGSSVSCARRQRADAADPWLSPFYYMRGLFLSSAEFPGSGPLLTEATAGAKLSLQARVYNYSFANMPPESTVHARFYAQPWDPTKNIALPGRESFLLGEDVLSPIPPFSNVPGAPLNWVLARATFDTTGYDNQFFTFWVVVWMQNADGTLVNEIPGHGLTSIPGTLTSFDQVRTEDYSNNLGFWKQEFYVAPQVGTVSSPGEDAPGALNIGEIQLSKNHVTLGQSVVVSALVSAENQDASNVETFFWDQDPNPENASAAEPPLAFDVEMPPFIAAGEADQVSAVYTPKTCGDHRVFVSVGLETANAVISQSQPIHVDCVAQTASK